MFTSGFCFPSQLPLLGYALRAQINLYSLSNNFFENPLLFPDNTLTAAQSVKCFLLTENDSSYHVVSKARETLPPIASSRAGSLASETSNMPIVEAADEDCCLEEAVSLQSLIASSGAATIKSFDFTHIFFIVQVQVHALASWNCSGVDSSPLGRSTEPTMFSCGRSRMSCSFIDRKLSCVLR